MVFHIPLIIWLTKENHSLVKKILHVFGLDCRYWLSIHLQNPSKIPLCLICQFFLMQNIDGLSYILPNFGNKFRTFLFSFPQNCWNGLKPLDFISKLFSNLHSTLPFWSGVPGVVYTNFTYIPSCFHNYSKALFSPVLSQQVYLTSILCAAIKSFSNVIFRLKKRWLQTWLVLYSTTSNQCVLLLILAVDRELISMNSHFPFTFDHTTTIFFTLTF